ncbi:receptor-like kinase TMK4 isoform X2 [Cynara cardunculus var. scolymus]|uniref:receptor-like kinase TMK4 isoform X2 n=1 Tax=Cynara cardunculus var. scolymus TaxID=59895 RepID=UPI000D62626D|nr:receptor-like kinase TMK4 isoform X2 [Cynara cardunculus var. scolymus]
MAYHDARHLRLLCLTFFLLLLSFTAADDAAVMAKLSTSLSPALSSWKSNTDFCKWEGITCDDSKLVTSINIPSKSLTGNLPSDINQLSQLKTLNLQRNSLSGDLPTLANLTLLEQLNLESNNFTSIPPGFFSGLTSLQSFSISDNSDLSPWVLPNDLTQSSNLQSFQASNANIMSSIPDFFDSFRNLQNLRLSYNNLTGNLPRSFIGSEIQNLWLNNQLQGLSGKDVSSGPPGSGLNGGNGGGGTPGGAAKKVSVSTGMVVGIVIGALVFVVIVSFVSYKCYTKKRNQKPKRVDDPENGKELVKASIIGGSSDALGVFSELQSQSSGDHSEMPVFEGGNVTISIQVLRQVTNNFSDENVLGRGGFGIVYKGELHDGTKIAVKRMESGVMGTKGLKEFQAEIAVLTKVRHRHLVALLGYCINGNERLLVYEYMPQGTLSQHLFEWREYKSDPLSWKQRVSIALDVGRGVEYLHSLAQQSFIHRDLKPSNILLGDDMRAKVADFGLVKSAPDGKYSVETRLAGTFGYLAPEYAATGRVTTKVDVYAFGVVLMELITGRKALDETVPDDRSHLVTWFRRVLISKENIVKAIDQTLDTEDEETLESICKVAELAGHCTAREPYQRPDMGHAVNVLGPLVELWKPSTHEEEDGNGIDLHMSLPQILQRWQADEGTSSMFDTSFTQTQSSIPSKPSGLADTFDSTNGR